MEALWDKEKFIGAKITKEEADVLIKVIGKLRLSDLDKAGLSEEERFLLKYIFYELGKKK